MKSKRLLLCLVSGFVFVGHSFAAASECEDMAAAYARVAAVAMEAQCAGASDSDVMAAAKAASTTLKARLSDKEIADAASTLTANIKSGDRSSCDAANKAAKSLGAITKTKVSLADAVVDQIEQQILLQCGQGGGKQ